MIIRDIFSKPIDRDLSLFRADKLRLPICSTIWDVNRSDLSAFGIV